MKRICPNYNLHSTPENPPNHNFRVSCFLRVSFWALVAGTLNHAFGSPRYVKAYGRSIHTCREAAESRLGQDALIADKDLLVQWRAADSLVYDTLHPKKVVEMARDRELEIMRLNLAHAAAVQSPRGVNVPLSPGVNPLSFGRSARDNGRNGRNDVPDLYQEV